MVVGVISSSLPERLRKMSAATILSEGGLRMLLNMLRVRDFNVQYSCTRALLHLIRHSGQVKQISCYSDYSSCSSSTMWDLGDPVVNHAEKLYWHSDPS